MKHILSVICHLALVIAAAAQTTTLTINNSTGQVNVPAGLTPYFDALAVAGTPVPPIATPQQYGAIADGTSHPVSEWVTSGRYANLAAIQADFPHVISLADEIDWAAAQQALRLNKAIFLPSVTGGYVFGNTTISHTLVTMDDGQTIYGAAPSGPYGNQGLGTKIIGGYGVDAIRCQTAATRVQNLTVIGRALPIHSITGNPAALTVSAGHGLRTQPVFTSGWSITGSANVADVYSRTRTVITTSAPHYLTTGDWVKITGSADATLNGIWQVNVCDAAATALDSPSKTATHFTLVRDQSEPLASVNMGACSFVQIFETIIGSYYGSGGTVTGAVPADGSGEVLGRYLVLPTNSTTAAIYKYDRTAFGLTTNANNDTGALFVTHRGLCEGDDQSITNYNQSQDHGKLWSSSNLFIKDCVVGLYGSNSDGGGKADHIRVSTCGTCLWADGNLDTMEFDACWIDASMFAGYRVSRNGGMIVIGGGAVNCARSIYLGTNDTTTFNGGSSFYGYGMYFEGHQRDVFADGTYNYYVDATGGNNAVCDGFRFQDNGENPIHFHCAFAGGSLTIRNAGSFANRLKAYSQSPGGQIYGDSISSVKVNLYGSTPATFDVGTYEAGDYWAFTADNGFQLSQVISAVTQTSTTTRLTVEDGTQFTVGDTVSTFDTVNSANSVNFKTITATGSNWIEFTNASGVTSAGGGTVEKQTNEIPGARFGTIGQKALVVPYGGGTTPLGVWQVLNISGKPKWAHIGFDTLEVARGGTGQTTFSTGDTLYSSAANTLSRLPAGAAGKVLTMSGGIPSWQDAPGNFTTYVGYAGSYLNGDSIHTTLTNYVSIAPTGGVPVGKYKIVIEGGYAVGPGGAGLQWDLKGGTATFARIGAYRRQLQWNHSGGIYVVGEFSTDDGTNGLNGDIVNGEFWGTGNPGVLGAGGWGFRYEGMIDVTVAGSIIFRVACADATNGTTITDEGQFTKGTNIILIKQ